LWSGAPAEPRYAAVACATAAANTGVGAISVGTGGSVGGTATRPFAYASGSNGGKPHGDSQQARAGCLQVLVGADNLFGLQHQVLVRCNASKR
jgi:hypothetical protein